jgi:hypothetical protein
MKGIPLMYKPGVSIAIDRHKEQHFIYYISKQDLLAHQMEKSPEFLPPKSDRSLTGRDGISALLPFPTGSAVIFPKYGYPTLNTQKMGLRQSASSCGMKIEIDDHNKTHFLVKNVSPFWVPREELKVLTPIDMYNYDRNKHKELFEPLPSYSYLDYRMFVDKMLELYNDEGQFGCTVLVPLFGDRDEISQRVQLAHWAKVRGIRIHINRIDRAHLGIRLKGYLEQMASKVLVPDPEDSKWVENPEPEDLELAIESAHDDLSMEDL